MNSQTRGSTPSSTSGYHSWTHQIITHWIKVWNTISLLDILSIIAVIIGLIIRVIKAYKLPLVSDEAYTYVHYAHESIGTILSSYIYLNNHLLNSILMHFLLNFGNTNLFLRIPSLIGSIIFLISVYLILKLIANKEITAIAISVIAVQPFLVDFGSLARGYSLGLAFSFLGLYIILKIFVHKRSSLPLSYNLMVASLCFILAMVAVPIFVNMIGPLFILICLFDCREQNANQTHQPFSSHRFIVYLKYLFLPTIAITYIIYINIFAHLTHQQFIFGFPDSVTSLNNFIVKALLYRVTANDITIMTMLFVSIVSLIWLIIDGVKKKNKIIYTLGILPFLSISFNLLEHYIFHVPYPLERVVIYLVPLIIISQIYFLVTLIDVGIPYVKRLNYQYTVIFISIVFILFTLSLNSTSYFIEWKNNSVFEFYKVSCDGGNAESCLKACNAGIADGCNHLGIVYYNGYGKKPDYLKAADYFKKSCDNNDLLGCNNLGLMYEKGLGVAQDYSQAYNLFELSCKGGFNPGCINLGTLFFYGRGLKLNYLKAFDLFKKTCDDGEAFGCTYIGIMYAEGKGVKQDYPKALGYFHKACYEGDKSGCDNFNKLLHPAEN